MRRNSAAPKPDEVQEALDALERIRMRLHELRGAAELRHKVLDGVWDTQDVSVVRAALLKVRNGDG